MAKNGMRAGERLHSAPYGGGTPATRSLPLWSPAGAVAVPVGTARREAEVSFGGWRARRSSAGTTGSCARGLVHPLSQASGYKGISNPQTHLLRVGNRWM